MKRALYFALGLCAALVIWGICILTVLPVNPVCEASRVLLGTISIAAGVTFGVIIVKMLRT